MTHTLPDEQAERIALRDHLLNEWLAGAQVRITARCKAAGINLADCIDEDDIDLDDVDLESLYQH